MQDIVFKGPLNSLSFGNVTYNFLREMYRKQMNVAIFPIGDDIKLDAFDKIDENFKKWMVERVQNRFHLVKKDIPTLTMWHLNGSEQRITPDQYLYTFYETNEPTLVEKSICDLQNKTIFSTNHASDAFKKLAAITLPQFQLALMKILSKQAKHIFQTKSTLVSWVNLRREKIPQTL